MLSGLSDKEDKITLNRESVCIDYLAGTNNSIIFHPTVGYGLFLNLCEPIGN